MRSTAGAAPGLSGLAGAAAGSHPLSVTSPTPNPQLAFVTTFAGTAMRWTMPWVALMQRPPLDEPF